MARLGLQTVTAFVLAATALGFVAPTASRGGLSVRGRALQMKQHTGDFWIAPSILSADFAKLGQEVRLPGLAWPRLEGLLALIPFWRGVWVRWIDGMGWDGMGWDGMGWGNCPWWYWWWCGCCCCCWWWWWWWCGG